MNCTESLTEKETYTETVLARVPVRVCAGALNDLWTDPNDSVRRKELVHPSLVWNQWTIPQIIPHILTYCICICAHQTLSLYSWSLAAWLSIYCSLFFRLSFCIYVNHLLQNQFPLADNKVNRRSCNAERYHFNNYQCHKQKLLHRELFVQNCISDHILECCM